MTDSDQQSIVAPDDGRLKAFREEVRVARAMARMSQSELGSSIGRSQTWISSMETGVVIPGIDDVLALADVLKDRIGHNIMEVFV